MKTSIYSNFIAQATEQLQDVFGDNLLSVVLLGSLAHGGFSERFSDIDIAVILKQAVINQTIDTAKQRISALEPSTLARRMSLFWTVPDFSWGRLRLVDQVDLHDNGQVLWGHSLTNLAPRPTLDAVRADMETLSLPYWAEKTAYFTTHLPVDEGQFKEYVRCLLYSARLILTWHTGKLGGNDEAVSYLEQLAPLGLSQDLVRDALSCRNGKLNDTELYRYQSLLAPQYLATLKLLSLNSDTFNTENSQ